MSVGPTSAGPTPMSIIGGAPTRVYSSAKRNCSTGVAPRPPYSRGQWSPAQPPSKRRRCHQRAKRTFSAGSSGFGCSGVPHPEGRFATSQSWTSRWKRASASVRRKSIAVVVDDGRPRRQAVANGPLIEGLVVCDCAEAARCSDPVLFDNEAPMIDHVSIPVAEVERAARFYDAVLLAVGLRRRKE